MADNGLRIMRRIDPPADLQAALEQAGQLYEISDKSNRSWLYVDDREFRDADTNNEITGNWDWLGRQTHHGCTLGFAVMNEENDILTFVNAADKAQRVIDSAKVTITTQFDYDLDDEEVVQEGEDEPDTLPAPRKSKQPVAVSA